LPLTISATYLAFCFVVVEVVELAAIVVRVEVEITVVTGEGVVLRRGPLIPSPSGGEEYCGVGAPLRYQFYTNKHTLFRLCSFVDTLSKSMLETSSQGSCQAS
jgi:hypothetical protein